MTMLRIAVPIGLIIFGAVAAFMGFAVVVSSLRTGEINYSYGPESAKVSQNVSQAADPDAYWRAVGMIGGLPLFLGVAAVWSGRRMMRSASE